MWEGRKLLLAAVIFTAACYQVTAGSPSLLDVLKTPDAADYPYTKCRQKGMEKFIHSGLLRQELNKSKEFQTAWNSNECEMMIPGGIKEHTTALSICNTDGFLKSLNDAIKSVDGNVNIYEKNFHFKSLYFLLMDSMWLLNTKQECKTVYIIEEQRKPQKGSKIRLEGFTVVNSDFNELKKWNDLSDQTILNITSCFFVDLMAHGCSKEDSTVLLSPEEVFTVERVHTKNVENDDYEYEEIVLQHSGLESSLNCSISSRSPVAVSTQWLVPVLVASSFSLAV